MSQIPPLESKPGSLPFLASPRVVEPSLARLYFKALSCSDDTSLLQRIAAWAVTVLTGIIPALFIGGLVLAWENTYPLQADSPGIHHKSNQVAKRHLLIFNKQHQFPSSHTRLPKDKVDPKSTFQAVSELMLDPHILVTKKKFPKIWQVLLEGPSSYFHINKRYMLLKSLESYAAHTSKNSISPPAIYQLNDIERGHFRCFCVNAPVYIHTLYQPKQTAFQCFASYFQYKPDPSGLPIIVTDFSDKCFGGAVLGQGFVQEEKMLFEFPELLEQMLASGITSQLKCLLQIRRPLDDGPDQPGAEGPGRGHPDPVLFEGVERSLIIHDKIYGSLSRTLGSGNQMLQTGYRDATDEEIQKYTQASPPPFDSLHILAITPPKVAHKFLEEQFSYTTMIDLINTSLAGLQLAHKKFPLGFIWRTGCLGCGALNNHPLAAYLAQRLAAEHMGVTQVELYGYSSEEAARGEEAWDQFRKLTKRVSSTAVPQTIYICSQMLVQVAKEVISKTA